MSRTIFTSHACVRHAGTIAAGKYKYPDHPGEKDKNNLWYQGETENLKPNSHTQFELVIYFLLCCNNLFRFLPSDRINSLHLVFLKTYSGKFNFVAVKLVLVEIPRCLNSIALTGKYLRNAVKLSRRNRAEKNLILCLAHQKLHRVNDPSIGFEWKQSPPSLPRIVRKQTHYVNI